MFNVRKTVLTNMTNKTFQK